MRRKTYTYEDELRARRIGAIAGILYVIAMFIWLAFDSFDYKTDAAISFLGQFFGPVLACVIIVAIFCGLLFLVGLIKKLFVKFIKMMFPNSL